MEPPNSNTNSTSDRDTKRDNGNAPSDDGSTGDSGAMWNVWRACDQLIRKACDERFYPEMTEQVVEVVRDLGHRHGGDPQWRSLLHKRSLLHELEESIVVLHQMILACPMTDPYILVDACGGKGLLSMLFALLAPDHLNKVILLEKVTTINWHHIKVCNEAAVEQGRPEIEIWAGANLHDYDAVLGRLQQLELPVSMAGIHLCKQLGPSFCGLVNGLGKVKCPLACLAPCCLPRAVTSRKHINTASTKRRTGKEKSLQKLKTKSATLAVQLYESQAERESRMDLIQRRMAMKKKPMGGPCFLCHDPDHGLFECPQLAVKSKEEQVALKRREHAARVPCWKCGELGHYKDACPKAQSSTSASDADTPAQSISPPCVSIDVSTVLQQPQPFQSYCQLLGSSLQQRQVQIFDPGLKNENRAGQHQEGNWNQDRKSVYMMIR